MNLDDPTHVKKVTAPRANTAFAVQGMASSFDTHGHFAVLLGLSFRRWRTHGGFWWILGTFFQLWVLPWWFLREPGLVGAFFWLMIDD